MSDLPDDVRRWPSDPFKLLGVPRNVQARELKRIYTRLIRAYKPEHAPEEFRRIREAYDSVRQFVELYSAFQQVDSSEPEDQPRPIDVQSAAEPGQATERLRLPRVKSLEEQLDECWRWAIEGDDVRAYRTLEELHAQAPHDPRVNVRLYWLLTVSRRLDSQRLPCDWLVAGLKRSALTGPLRELYRRELAANAAEALSGRCAELMASAPVSSSLAELIEWRWQAIARTEQAAEVICADLALLRERFLAHDEESWARLVLAAVDRVAFVDTAPARELLNRCRHDLAGMTHLHLRLSAAFDRFELLEDIAAKSRQFRGAAQWHSGLVEVIRQAWTLPIEESRPRLLAYLATVASRPGETLRNFDAVQQVASPLLFQFRRALSLLESVSEPAADGRTAQDIQELALSFARHTPGARYSEWRPQLLDFCLREVLMPEQVAAALADNIEFQLTAEQHLSQAAINDLPLVCVCHACRLLWA